MKTTAFLVGLAVLCAVTIASVHGAARTPAEASEKVSDAAPKKATEAPAKTESAPGKIESVTFDTIKLDLKKGDPFDRKVLTDDVKKIDGKSVRIRGYILPSFQQTGIKQFVLVRDNQQCCFGPGAALFDCILVEMNEGLTTEFSISPITVEGKFSVKEVVGPDGNHLAIYRLDATSAK